MKTLITWLLVLTCLTGTAQSRLTDLFSLDAGINYPTNMPHIKDWINSSLAPIFVRNLQFSDNISSSSKFISFNPSTRAGFTWPLGVDGLKVIPNNSTISGIYEHDIFSYLRRFDVTKFDYQPYSYFVLAKDILKINDPEMLANTLNFFTAMSLQKSAYKQLIDQLNTIKRANLSYPATENVRELAKVIDAKYPGKITDVIYDCYIKGKTTEITKSNIERFYRITGFFPSTVDERINDMINPKIKFKQDKPFVIELPSKALKLNGLPDSVARFSVETGSLVLDYKNRALEISFKGKLNGEAAPSSVQYIDYKNNKIILTKLPSYAKPVPITEIKMVVAESGIKVTMASNPPDYGMYRVTEQAWKK